MARTGRSLSSAKSPARESEPSSLTDRILRKAGAHQEAGRMREALAQLARILERDAAHAEANYKAGVIRSQVGERAAAVPHLTAALRANPAEPRYWLSLATALLGLGRVADARAILERFVREPFTDPATQATKAALIGGLMNQAQVLFTDRAFAEAEALIEIVILLDENHSEAIHCAGLCAAAMDRPELAYDLMSIAIYKDGTSGHFFINLANIFLGRREYEPAVECLYKAIALGEDGFVTHNNLGLALHKTQRYDDALRHLALSIEKNPSNALAHNNCGVVHQDMGQIEEAIADYNRALALDPANFNSHSNRLFCKLYRQEHDSDDYLADASAFGRSFADPLLRRRPFRNDPTPERRLRVGFVSGDFYEHAVAYFLEPAVAALDRSAFELFAYSNTTSDDGTTERLRAHFDTWRSIRCLDDEATCDLIEADAIDILVDLSGHTAGNRLLVFARKPAPIQVSWIGYPATTGLAAIDYRFTDRFSEPAGIGDDHNVETLWRLPRVGACYRGNPRAPDAVARAPFEENGHITFGCFNRFTKVSDATLQAWAEILRRLPDARILFEIASVDSEAVRAEVEARLVRNGLTLDRLTLEPRHPRNRYVLYNRIDAGLDPFPYNGGTTSLDTLYMGVPFIALEGDHFAARMGHSILNNVGLPELSAGTVEAYVALAVRMGEDRDWLRGLRHGLRQRMQASPHMDNQGLAADIGDAFRAMWRRWLDTREA